MFSMSHEMGPEWLLLFGALADSEDEEAEEAQRSQEEDGGLDDVSPVDMGWDEQDEEDPNEGIWQP